MAASCRYNVYVGAETGLFKGVNTDRNVYQNLNSVQELGLKKQEISRLCWDDDSEKKIYVGFKDQIVRIFDVEQLRFTDSIEVKGGSGGLVGLCKYQSNILTCVESGLVKLWTAKKEDQLTISAGENVHRMQQNPQKPWIIATGGQENDLKLWDLNKPDDAFFKAKNVASNFLDLRVPIWVTDMQFIPESDKIVACTRHHHVRVYDPSSRQRRPVINMEFEDYPLMTLSLGNREHEVVVGSSRGRMALIDLRKKAMVHVFKGFAGGVREVKCHPTRPVVASCSLDRFLRVHDLYTHKLLVKMYLRSRLNCLLLSTKYYEALAKNAGQDMADNCDADDLWDKMDVVQEPPKKRKKPD